MRLHSEVQVDAKRTNNIQVGNAVCSRVRAVPRTPRATSLARCSDRRTSGMPAQYVSNDLLSDIWFAGRRVIEQTLQEKLPDNFQTSEYLLKHGLLDLIVPRPLLKQALAELLLLYKEAPLKRRGQISYGVKKGLYPEFDKKLRQEWRQKPNEANLKKAFDSLKDEGFSLSEENFKELMNSKEGNSDSLFEKALQLVSKSGIEWSLPSK